MRSLQFEARDGRSKRPAEFAPDFERVAEVQYELENPRLHDKGVVACAHPPPSEPLAPERDVCPPTSPT